LRVVGLHLAILGHTEGTLNELAFSWVFHFLLHSGIIIGEDIDVLEGAVSLSLRDLLGHVGVGLLLEQGSVLVDGGRDHALVMRVKV